MKRDEALAIVKAHQATLQELGVKSLDLLVLRSYLKH